MRMLLRNFCTGVLLTLVGSATIAAALRSASTAHRTLSNGCRCTVHLSRGMLHHQSNNKAVSLFPVLQGIQTTMPCRQHPSRAACLSSSSLHVKNANLMDPRPSSLRPTAVYFLLLVNLGVSFAETFLGKSRFVLRNLCMHHQYGFRWWQTLTSAFCHADRSHLSNNMFLLLLFGRSVEDDWGWGGLLMSFCFCSIASSLISLAWLPPDTVSLGASGAVFGLFTVSTLAKLQGGTQSLLDWRQWIELIILGDFVWRQLTVELATAARGGVRGVNHVAHLAGAAAGAMLVWGMRAVVTRMERQEKRLRG